MVSVANVECQKCYRYNYSQNLNRAEETEQTH